MPLPVTTAEDLDAHLAELGVMRGDDVLVHSQLMSFGEIVGGVDSVYAALRRTVGPQATIAVPTFTLWLEEGTVFDPASTPSQRMGPFAEFVRRHPDAQRSSCPWHNHAAIGPKAHLLAEQPGTVSLGEGSDFDIFHREGFKVLFLGVAMRDSATYTMHCEAVAEVPYRRWLTLERPRRDPDGAVRIVQVRYFGRAQAGGTDVDLVPMEEALLASGKVRTAPCPLGRSCYLSLADFHAVMLPLLVANPYFLVRESARP